MEARVMAFPTTDSGSLKCRQYHSGSSLAIEQHFALLVSGHSIDCKCCGLRLRRTFCDSKGVCLINCNYRHSFLQRLGVPRLDENGLGLCYRLDASAESQPHGFQFSALMVSLLHVSKEKGR